jgi:DNA repair exonuclease SbcCD ATPase subunit
MSLCHGSADMERGFSRSALLMTRLQARTEERALKAKAFVADALRYCENRPERVLITNKLLCLAGSARASYELYLFERRQEESEREKLEAEKKDAEQEIQEMARKKQKIADLESDIVRKKEMVEQKKEIGDTLLREAGERLKKAVEEKDFLNIGLAQSMLEAALKARSEERERADNAESVEVLVLKRKSELIDCLSKKSKK